MTATVEENVRPDCDPEIRAIADYVLDYTIDSPLARDTARHCLMDTLGCGLLALGFPEYVKHLGPRVEGMIVPNGARVPGAQYRLDPEKRSITNAPQVFFTDGDSTDRVEIEFPIGHPRRRGEGIPRLVEKFRRNLVTVFPPVQCERIMQRCEDPAALETTPVHEFTDLLVPADD